MAQPVVAAAARYGSLGRVLIADLSTRTTRVEALDESIYRQFLGGYGLGAYLMWKHFPAGADPLAPESCFAIVSGLLTGARTPFSGRIQIVGKSPLTGTWADSNSGGSVASQLRRAGYDALLVTGRASEPTVLVVRDAAGDVRARGRAVGQGDPAGVRRAAHALRQAIRGRRERDRPGRRAAVAHRERDERPLPRLRPPGLRRDLRLEEPEGDRRARLRRSADRTAREASASCARRSRPSTRQDLSWKTRLMVWFAKPKPMMGFMYRAMSRFGIKVDAPRAGDAAALVGSRHDRRGRAQHRERRRAGEELEGRRLARLPARHEEHQARRRRGGEVHHEEALVRRLPGAVQGHRRGEEPRPHRRAPARLRDDRGLRRGDPQRRPRGRHRLPRRLQSLRHRRGQLERDARMGVRGGGGGHPRREDLDGIDMRWGNGEGALALTVKMGTGRRLRCLAATWPRARSEARRQGQ